MSVDWSTGKHKTELSETIIFAKTPVQWTGLKNKKKGKTSNTNNNIYCIFEYIQTEYRGGRNATLQMEARKWKKETNL